MDVSARKYNDGNRAMLNVMMADPAAARRMLSRRRVDYVVICAGSLEQADFVRLAPAWRPAPGAAS